MARAPGEDEDEEKTDGGVPTAQRIRAIGQIWKTYVLYKTKDLSQLTQCVAELVS
jgi:hypothetical protein